MQRFILLTVLFFVFSSVWAVVYAAVYVTESVDRENPVSAAQKLMNQGLHKDALDLLRPWILDPKTVETEIPDKDTAVTSVCQLLQKLNRVSETDEFLEKAAEIHQTNWKMLIRIALTYTHGIDHHGYIIDGTFQRGQLRGGNGQHVTTMERDRVRALQIYVNAMPLVLKDKDKKESGSFFLQFAEAVTFNDRLNNNAWKLQSLTDLNDLPDYETHWYGGSMSKAPVDAEDNPVYYYVPESWETAKNDGERWRWLLNQAEKQNPDLRNQTLLQRAQFNKSQFGEQTLQTFFRNMQTAPETTASILNLETLNDNETTAQLATGIKRFKIPDEFNYIALYKKIQETGDQNMEITALESLAGIYKNRRQFPRAADCYKKMIQKYSDNRKKHWQEQFDQINGNWGRFEPSGSKVAGLHAELRYVFRNGKKVNLTAHRIDDKKLIDDIKTYLQSKPSKLDWNKIHIDQIGQRLFYGDDQKTVREKYLGEEVTKWSVELQPYEKHFNQATTISVPIHQAGTYLIRAEMENGNVESVVLWLNDTVIVQKTQNKGALYFVADAETGKPVTEAEVHFFGYKMENVSSPAANNRQRQNPQPVWTFANITKQTDENGSVILEEKHNNFTWLAEVNVPSQKRFAYLGFNHIWFYNYNYSQYNSVKTFVITDRPVYRPNDTVKIKTWIGTAKYDLPDTNEWADKTIYYEIYNPRGEKIVEKTNVKLDAYGGMTAELELPKEAMLGNYHINVNNFDNGFFRVEEYKKPEYEVTIDAPKEPVKLGDKITVTIQAKYYFGSPVTDATVKYKILSEKANADWYPIRYWDWFYGCGYSWFAYDSPWLNGWYRWGCSRPLPFWLPHYSGPPEVIAEQEVRISENGTVKVVIDTEIAKQMFPNDNRKYTITAEVIDKSRRTIVGTGSVLVSKEPFKIYAWTDCGFYRPNQKIGASFQARRLDGKPVSGNGTVKLYKINYNNDNEKTVAHEHEVHSETVTFNEDGTAQITLNAAESGQYRISCTLNDQEGGYVFNVYEQNNQQSPKQQSASFKYNAIELIPDKAEYAPGENVTLRINTERENSFVILFTRTANGIVSEWQLLRLSGKSHEISIPVELRDMPNFFIEALTVSGGEMINETKEIVVPPQKKVLNVEVKPSAETYKPGEKAKAELVVTDLDGKPVSGQITVAVYDKSIEYISGGSNVRDIKEFFWKWRRHHVPRSESNLLRYFNTIPEPNKPVMQNLGVFGNILLPLYKSGEGTVRLDFNENFNENGKNIIMGKGILQRGMFAGKADQGVSLGLAVTDNFSAFNTESTMALPAEESIVTTSVEPVIRKNFADTALWIGTLETNEKGVAQIELDMPESLTTWKINVWTMAHGTRVGYGNSEVITRKDLILRMQTPRFLIEKDKVLLTANVHNYLKTEKEVEVVLEIDDHLLTKTPSSAKIKIAPDNETRIDWIVETKTAGNTVIRMKALTDEESDAMEKTLPVYVHGMLKQDSFSAYIAPEKDSATITVNVPAERQPEKTKLTVRFSPTLAMSMIDALPYLADYPYGCTEQTLNRFLPTVIVHKLLAHGYQLPVEGGKDWAIARKISPVFDKEQITEMVRDGVTKLTNMQNADGGWGWFGGYGEHSSAHLTALVVHGLKLAQRNDVAVDSIVPNRGRDWLYRYQKEQVELLNNSLLSNEEKKEKRTKLYADDTDAFVVMVLAEVEDRFGLMGTEMTKMREYLWRDRGKLSPYGAAMFGIALKTWKLNGNDEKAEACVKIIEQYLVQDDENQTAYLNLNNYSGWCWWAWHGSEFETQAYYLKLLMRTNPKSSVAPRLVKYLLNNRRHATYWNSTRDTAICIEAFAEFLKATGEDKPNMTVDVLIDGNIKKSVEFTPENLLTVDNTLILEGDAVSSLSNGEHKIELRKRGNNPLYATVYLENFTLEDPIQKSGLEVKIERKIYKLVRDENASAQVAGNRGQVLEQKVEKYKRHLTEPLCDVLSGDLIEVELIVESKNDYESLLIEDRKPAGFEPVDVRSGYNGNELGAYVEFRDERVVFFVYRLARGKHSVTYRLRAEQPGEFSALPAGIEAMYAPELKGNSDENKVRIQDKK
ncbi:MAG: alpha-2-macroglobulin [Planctomycetaceae bacterium]|jgi:uncharacterized protein YfaS (alpha-2-macroglobulin family)|nr:alpha-2-macroglobulin [Planctomycetaceae bacterium]